MTLKKILSFAVLFLVAASAGNALAYTEGEGCDYRFIVLEPGHVFVLHFDQITEQFAYVADNPWGTADVEASGIIIENGSTPKREWNPADRPERFSAMRFENFGGETAFVFARYCHTGEPTMNVVNVDLDEGWALLPFSASESEIGGRDWDDIVYDVTAFLAEYLRVDDPFEKMLRAKMYLGGNRVAQSPENIYLERVNDGPFLILPTDSSGLFNTDGMCLVWEWGEVKAAPVRNCAPFSGTFLVLPLGNFAKAVYPDHEDDVVWPLQEEVVEYIEVSAPTPMLPTCLDGNCGDWSRADALAVPVMQDACYRDTPYSYYGFDFWWHELLAVYRGMLPHLDSGEITVGQLVALYMGTYWDTLYGIRISGCGAYRNALDATYRQIDAPPKG